MNVRRTSARVWNVQDLEGGDVFYHHPGPYGAHLLTADGRSVHLSTGTIWTWHYAVRVTKVTSPSYSLQGPQEILPLLEVAPGRVFCVPNRNMNRVCIMAQDFTSPHPNHRLAVELRTGTTLDTAGLTEVRAYAGAEVLW